MNGCWPIANGMALRKGSAMGWQRELLWGWVLCSTAGMCMAQSIYTCTDAKGRRLTSDRPIPECLDREQRELNASGTLKRNVGPALSERDIEQAEARRRKDVQDQVRLDDVRRQERAMLIRYKDEAAHNVARTEALKQVDDVMVFAMKRVSELNEERKSLDAELAILQKSATQVPLLLQKKTDDNAADLDGQRRFVLDKTEEKKQINERFDHELARLRQMWMEQAALRQ